VNLRLDGIEFRLNELLGFTASPCLKASCSPVSDLDRSAVSRLGRNERYAQDYEVAALARCLKVTIGWLYAETA
jgi:hypothetical protein